MKKIEWKGTFRQVKYSHYVSLIFAFGVLNVVLGLIATPNHTFKNLSWYYGIGQQMQSVGLFGIWTPYPPWFALFIYLFTAMADNLDWFFIAWELLNLAMLLATGFLIYKIVAKYDKQTAFISAIGFSLVNLTLTSAISVGFYQDQFDYLPILLMMASLHRLLNDRPMESALLCGVGTMTKLFPVVVLPVACLFLNNRERMGYVFVFALTCALAVLPWLIVNPGALRSSYEFSMSRDAWETVWNFPMMKFPPIPVPKSFTIPFHSDASLYPWLTWLAGAVALGCLWWHRNEKSETAVPRILLSLLLVFLIFSKGVSSYYILWLFPVLFLIYKPIYAFGQCAVLLLVGDIEFMGAPPIQPFPYWLAIFGRHAVFLGLLIQALFRRPGDRRVSLFSIATPRLARDPAITP